MPEEAPTPQKHAHYGRLSAANVALVQRCWMQPGSCYEQPQSSVLRHLIRSIHYLRLASGPRSFPAKITICDRSLRYQTDHVIPRAVGLDAHHKQHTTIVSRTRGQSLLLKFPKKLHRSDLLRLLCRMLKFSLQFYASTS